MNKMKNMPGMGNIQETLSKMGLGGLPKGGKLDLNAMEAKLKETMKTSQMKERMRQKADDKKAHQAQQAHQAQMQAQENANKPTMSDAELVSLFDKTNNGSKTDKKSKKKGKK
jgi:hypothetical protein